jgi:hypothetical protein
MVDRRSQKKTILAIEATLVVAVTPGPDVTGAEVLKAFHARDSASPLQLPHVLLEYPLTTPSENDLGFFSVADRHVGFDFLTEVLLPLGQVGFPLNDVRGDRRSIEKDACCVPDQVHDGLHQAAGDLGEIHALQTSSVRKERRVLRRKQMPKIRHVIRRSHFVRENLEADVYFPADQAPVGSGGAELRRLRALVGIGPRDTDRTDVRALEGEDEVSWGDFTHELVKRIAGSVCIPLR